MTRGSARTVLGSPSAIFSPWSSTVMYSDTPMITCMSCSMSRIARPSSSRAWRMNFVRPSDSCGFMPAVGSSSSRSFGVEDKARAISTRR